MLSIPPRINLVVLVAPSWPFTAFLFGMSSAKYVSRRLIYSQLGKKPPNTMEKGGRKPVAQSMQKTS